MSKEFDQHVRERLVSQMPVGLRYVTHVTAPNDPRENFLRIRNQKLWDDLEAKRAANASPSPEGEGRDEGRCSPTD